MSRQSWHPALPQSAPVSPSRAQPSQAKPTQVKPSMTESCGVHSAPATVSAEPSTHYCVVELLPCAQLRAQPCDLVLELGAPRCASADSTTAQCNGGTYICNRRVRFVGNAEHNMCCFVCWQAVHPSAADAVCFPRRARTGECAQPKPTKRSAALSGNGRSGFSFDPTVVRNVR